ncbi:MAG: hypothetical protein ACYSTY_10135 [Planctomycetota bacterium]|jgi:V8-like Glu-specific endopeptidase
MRWSLPAALAIAAAPVSWTHAQSTLDRPSGEPRPYLRDSGLRANDGDTSAALFREIVRVEGAAWMRVYFGAVELAAGSTVRLTSILDDEVQELDAAGLAQWGNTSAYFNGDSVVVELMGGPKTARNRLVIEHVTIEIAPPPLPIGGCGICGPDDRVPTTQNWTGRLQPAGCTASVWNEESCLVSAGHCVDGNDVIEFQVPASDPGCNLDDPPVADQFPIIESLYVSGGVGNDWAVLCTGTNNLGETAFERYGQLRAIAEDPVGVGQFLSVWGYGVDTECVRSETQQSSSGNVMSVQSSYYTHDVDTTFGNSGSAIIYHCLGCDPEIVAIATHCSCPNNIGTRVDLPAFAAARATLCPQPCATDVNLDGVINVLDLIELLLCFGQPGLPPCDRADIDGNGTVNVLDLIELLLDFGTTCP